VTTLTRCRTGNRWFVRNWKSRKRSLTPPEGCTGSHPAIHTVKCIPQSADTSLDGCPQRAAHLVMKVLVADHEPVWLEFVCTHLSAAGLQPMRVVNGERAWSVLEERDAPRLAIIDRRLPAVNAIEICRRLRARGDSFYTYVLMLVPNAFRVEELVALEAGADDCLAKPFSQEDFVARLAIARRILDLDHRLTVLNGRWRNLLDSLPFGVATVDARGILKRLNATFATQMGYTEVRSLIGQSLTQVFQRHADLRGLLEEVRWAEPFNDVEVQCRGVIGKAHSMRLWGRPLPPNDEAVYEIVVQESLPTIGG